MISSPANAANEWSGTLDLPDGEITAGDENALSNGELAESETIDGQTNSNTDEALVWNNPLDEAASQEQVGLAENSELDELERRFGQGELNDDEDALRRLLELRGMKDGSGTRDALSDIQETLSADGYKTELVRAGTSDTIHVWLESGHSLRISFSAGAFEEDAVFFAKTIAWDHLDADQARVLSEQGITPLENPVLFDIGFMDRNFAEIEPRCPIELNITEENIGEREGKIRMDVVHIDETGGFPNAEIVASTDADHVSVEVSGMIGAAGSAQVEDGRATATIEAGSFSIYAIKYTVDFYLDSYEFHLNGGDHMTLSALMDSLGVGDSASAIESVEFSGPNGLLLFERLADGSDWIITSLNSFTEWYKLKLKAKSGNVYVIDVTDAPDTANAENACLMFSSPSPFTLRTYNNQKNWNGTLQYSTDGSSWSTWSGTTTEEAGTPSFPDREAVRVTTALC